MKAFVCQSNWVPWRGYFAAIREVDLFVIYDHVQFSKGSWRNRNIIEVEGRKTWLSLPVITKGRSKQYIDEVQIQPSDWWISQEKQILRAYGTSNYLENLKNSFLEPMKTIQENRKLTEVNEFSLRKICQMLEIKTQFARYAATPVGESATDRLLNCLQQFGITHYLSGPSAKAYLEESKFKKVDIRLEYLSYSKLPSNESNLSILDNIARMPLDELKKSTTFLP